MARQSEFINKLTDFTKSLDSLVELLQEQNKTSPTEVINTLLENLDAQSIAKISENMEIIKTNTTTISGNVEKTLEAVKSIKKEKESGMFGEIEDKNNKNKVTEGIKTVILIAAGVLAIGMAFKIIGAVDFFSVIALGLGIVFVAEAFARVASIKDDKGEPMTWKKAFLTAGILVLMSGAVLFSGLILSRVPIIGIFQLITIVGIGLGMGLAAKYLLQGLGHIKFKSLLIVPFLPMILPAIALGLVWSGEILKDMPMIGFKQILSAIGVGVAFIPISFAVSLMLKRMKNVTLKQILLLGVLLPVIALSIGLSSYILQYVADVPLWGVLKAGIAVGIATLFMVPTIVLLSKFGLLKPQSIKELGIALAVIPVLSSIIVLSSYILSFTENIPLFRVLKAGFGIGIATLLLLPTIILLQKVGLLKPSAVKDMLIASAVFPLLSISIVLSSYILTLTQDVPFTTVVKAGIAIGLATLAMVPTILFLQKAGLLKPSAILELLIATAAIVLISAAIMLSSWILSVGNYDAPVPYEWTLQTALGLLVFGGSMAAIGYLDPTLIFLSVGALGVLLVAATILLVSAILGAGNYGNFPSWEWSTSVGLSMVGFGAGMLLLGGMITASFGLGLIVLAAGAAGMLMVAQTIVDASAILAKGDYKTSYPTVDWAMGVGMAITTFSSVLIELTKLQMLSNMMSFFFGGGSTIDLPSFIIGVSTAILTAANMFNKSPGSFEKNYPSYQWAMGVGTAIHTFSSVLIELTKLQMLSDMFGTFFGGGAKIDLPAFITGVASALFVAGSIFSSGKDVFKGNYPKEDWAKGVGGAITAFTTAFVELTKLEMLNNLIGKFFGTSSKIDLGAFIRGVANALIDAGTAFTGAPDVFKGNYPDEKWAKGVGGTITAFAQAMSALDAAGVDIDADDLNDDDGAVAIMKGLALGLIDVGKIFESPDNTVKWDLKKVPTSDWGKNIGDSLKSFTDAMVVLSKSGFDADELWDFEANTYVADGPLAVVMAIGKGMVGIASILFWGNWSIDNIPTSDWNESLKNSLTSFTETATSLDISNIWKVPLTAIYMIISALYFNKLVSIPIPSEEWVNDFTHMLRKSVFAVGNIVEYLNGIQGYYQGLMALIDTSRVLLYFARHMWLMQYYMSAFEPDGIVDSVVSSIRKIVNVLPKQSEIDPLWSLIDALDSLSQIPWVELWNIEDVADYIGYLAHSIKQIDEYKVESLASLGASLHIMAVVDQVKLLKTLNVLDQKSKVLSQIMEEKSFMTRMLDTAADLIFGKTAGSNTGGGTTTQKQTTVNKPGKGDKSPKEDFEQQLLSYVKNIDTNIQKMSGIDEKQEERLVAKDVEDKSSIFNR